MNRKKIGYVFWTLSFLLSVAWLIESFTRGRGFVSTYLAPVAILGNILGVFLIKGPS